jgi:riboflavin kinase / FMN adenylyltransferase
VTTEGEPAMVVVHGVEQLSADTGPVFVVVGVFDGLHLGHLYLLRHLVAEARSREARPTVITFDHHPDEVLTGQAPPLLLDPRERLERLARTGVRVTVVQHFDEALRQTPYDVFVERIRDRVDLRGFLMTPDAAFGFERRGTPETLAELGQRLGFDVVVVPPFSLGGRAVRSSEIRTEIAVGNLVAAAKLLGRPVNLTGVVADEGPDGVGLEFELPLALPPAGEYTCTVNGQPGRLRIDRGTAFLRADVTLGALVSVEITGESSAAG